MTHRGPRLCRVSLHADCGQLDLALPAAVPIAALLPSVVDILVAREASRHPDRPAAPYRLSLPGATALDSAKTLAQHGIQDGTVLLLSRTFDELPAPRFDDPAEQVAATVRATMRPYTARAARCAGGLVAGWLAAVAGFVAVPGGPGAPNLLLAAAAATTVTMLAVQLGAAEPTMIAFCCLAVFGTAGALAAVLARVSPQVIFAAGAAVSIGLLHMAARLSIVLAGLSRGTYFPAAAGSDGATVHAHRVLTGLVAAFSATAALGALGVAIGAQVGEGPRFGGVAVAGVTGVALLLRARWHSDRRHVAVLAAGGIVALGAALAAGAAAVPQHRLWWCAAAGTLAGGALYVGFGRPELSPTARRGIELAEYPVLAAVLPVACWVCGCYGAVRGLALR